MATAKIIKTNITMTPVEATQNILNFVVSEIYGLSDETELSYNLTAGDVRKSIESIFYYMTLIDQKDTASTDHPISFTYARKDGLVKDLFLKGENN